MAVVEVLDGNGDRYGLSRERDIIGYYYIIIIKIMQMNCLGTYYHMGMGLSLLHLTKVNT